MPMGCDRVLEGMRGGVGVGKSKPAEPTLKGVAIHPDARKDALRCPVCGGPTMQRHGVHFEHERRCEEHGSYDPDDVVAAVKACTPAEPASIPAITEAGLAFTRQVLEQGHTLGNVSARVLLVEIDRCHKEIETYKQFERDRWASARKTFGGHVGKNQTAEGLLEQIKQLRAESAAKDNELARLTNLLEIAEGKLAAAKRKPSPKRKPRAGAKS